MALSFNPEIVWRRLVRIVLDASGGDHAPRETVAGAIAAARASGDQIILVGAEAAIRAELARHDLTNLDLPVVDAPEMIEMTRTSGAGDSAQAQLVGCGRAAAGARRGR
jgi:fatty acid/phospholipid biosynthesis enzyme